MDNLIAGIFGLQGSGKTALMSYLGKLYHDQGVPVYSNYYLNFEFRPVTTLKEAQSVRNGVLLLDEVWMWCHARTSASKINQEMMKIILMNRKRNVNIIYTTQLKRTVDIILKEVTNYVSYPKMIPGFIDGEKHFFISYVSANLEGKIVKKSVVPYPIEVVGSWFNTKEEVKRPGSQEPDPLSKGIGLEHDFAKAIKKLSFVRKVYVIPGSGKNTPFQYDVMVWDDKKDLYFFDIKGATSHVFLKKHGQQLRDQIDNAYEARAKPYLAFPVNDKVMMSKPSSWYVFPLTKYCYLIRLNAMPVYSKLSKNSMLLSKWSR